MLLLGIVGILCSLGYIPMLIYMFKIIKNDKKFLVLSVLPCLLWIGGFLASIYCFF